MDRCLKIGVCVSNLPAQKLLEATFIQLTSGVYHNRINLNKPAQQP